MAIGYVKVINPARFWTTKAQLPITFCSLHHLTAVSRGLYQILFLLPELIILHLQGFPRRPITGLTNPLVVMHERN